MEVRKLTKSNLSEYAELIRPDVAENIGRVYYRGFALRDQLTGENFAGIIWKIKDRDMKERRAEVKWFYAADMDYCRWLFRKFEELALKESVNSVSLEMPLGDEMSEEVLERLNYNMSLEESRILTITVNQCSRLIRGKEAGAFKIKPLSDLSLKQFNKAISLLKGKKHQGLYGAEDCDNLTMFWYDPDVSCAIFGEDGKPKGLLLIHETSLGSLKVELFFAEGKDARAYLVEMMSFCARAAQEKFPPGKLIEIDREGESARAITERLFSDAHGTNVVKAEKMI